MEAKYVRVLKEEIEDNIEEANKRIEYWKGRRSAFEQLLKQGGEKK